jgi:hypothetical protein
MEKFFLPLFLFISGLTLCGVVLPRWVLIVGGACGIIAGVLMLF